MTSILRELAESTTLNGRPIPGGETVAHLIAKVVMKEALKGNFQFAREFLDRHDGKVTDKVDITSGGQELRPPITIVEINHPAPKPPEPATATEDEHQDDEPAPDDPAPAAPAATVVEIILPRPARSDA